MTLFLLVALLLATALWATFGRLDIIASADGKLVPRTYLKIVQPAEAGVVREILVEEGRRVRAGDLMLRLDPSVADADTRALVNELAVRSLQLRRIDAELAGATSSRDASATLGRDASAILSRDASVTFSREAADPGDAYAQAHAQFLANRRAYHDALAQEAAAVQRTRHELKAAIEVHTKLLRTVPVYQTAAARFRTLRDEGFVSELFHLERERDRIEKEQDLAAQSSTVEGLRAALTQAEQRMDQVTSAYRQQLYVERAAASVQHEKLTEDLAKQRYRNTLVELTAPQAGVVKDLAVHTAGAVAAPGAVLLSIVPEDEELQADVMVSNQDVGFVRAGQRAKVKLLTYPFQKYGMLDGEVMRVSRDATETGNGRVEDADAEGKAGVHTTYRARIRLAAQSLGSDGPMLPLVSGMQVTAEIRLGDRTVLEYLLAPVQKAWHEAARER